LGFKWSINFGKSIKASEAIKSGQRGSGKSSGKLIVEFLKLLLKIMLINN
jgi:hypothetical protein